MKRKVFSARTEALIRACLVSSELHSDDEDRSDKDVIDDSRSNSPIKTGLHGTLKMAKSSALVTNKSNSQVHDVTSCTLRSEFAKPLNEMHNPEGHNHIAPGEKSIESPLTPKPLSLQREKILLNNFSLSPLPVMSPETAKMYTVLLESTERDSEEINNEALDSPLPPSLKTPTNLSSEMPCVLRSEFTVPVTKLLKPEELNHIAPGENSIESPLTPKPLCLQREKILLNNFSLYPLPVMSPETAKMYTVLLESTERDSEEINNEALDSPLPPSLKTPTNLSSEMPCVLRSEFTVPVTKLLKPEELNHIAPGEISIEAPPYSPLTPKPLLLQNKHIISNDYKLSPLPPMSPETDKIYKLLIGSTERNSIETDNNAAVSPSSYNQAELINSDDSVQDPDYVSCYDIRSSSDNSSENSKSLLVTHATPLVNNKNDLNATESAYINHEGEDILFHCDYESKNENKLSNSFDNDEETPGGTNTEEAFIRQRNCPETNRESFGRPKKGRKRKYGGLTREERKKRKYTNLSYVNSRKKTVDSKPFLDYNCGCTKECQKKISVEKRLEEFNKFYALGTYDAQNMFLAACVNENPVKRSYVTTNKTNISKKKTFTRQYCLKGIPVCREMFVKTLQTTSKRINTSLCKMRSDNCIIDKRGLQAGHNKTTTKMEEFFISIIEKLPTYVSHYRRKDCKDAKFLRSEMTFSKIYSLFCDEAKLAKEKTISFSTAKKFFLTKFNLRTKPVKKDTCNKCDFFESQLKHASDEDRVRIEHNHDTHLRNAKALQDRLKSDMKLAKEDSSIETLSFDLEKTLPLPRIPTNIIFYKRQLWVYNLGIHSGSDDQAHCNVWVEGEAGRGAQEVGSCLLKHIQERVDKNVKRLILWSDSCGGQNRNIKLTLMLKALLCDHPTLEEINIRFLESGHSFLPNDTDFGRIECALKLQQRLYTPDDYIEIMKSCKKNKPMQVHRMNKDDFLSSSMLEKNITNRKKTTDGSKVSWLKTKEVMLKKEEIYSIFMRSDLEEDYQEVNLKKKVRSSQRILTKEEMEPLWPNGKPIPEAKLKDLKSILHLIPKDAQGFYKYLTGDAQVDDDIDGFSGDVDFEIEVDDDINI